MDEKKHEAIALAVLIAHAKRHGIHFLDDLCRNIGKDTQELNVSPSETSAFIKHVREEMLKASRGRRFVDAFEPHEDS